MPAVIPLYRVNLSGIGDAASETRAWGGAATLLFGGPLAAGATIGWLVGRRTDFFVGATAGVFSAALMWGLIGAWARGARA